MTTRCHSVFSLRSPVALSRQLSEVATRKLTIGRPSCVRRTSGSAPRLPTRITLLTLPAMTLSTLGGLESRIALPRTHDDARAFTKIDHPRLAPATSEA